MTDLTSAEALRHLASLVDLADRQEPTIPELIELHALASVLGPKLERFTEVAEEMMRERGHEPTVRVVPKAEMGAVVSREVGKEMALLEEQATERLKARGVA